MTVCVCTHVHVCVCGCVRMCVCDFSCQELCVYWYIILCIRCTEACFVTFKEGIICLSCNFYVKWCTVGTDICTVDVVISSFNYTCCDCVSGY
jgi:hypothetical protein